MEEARRAATNETIFLILNSFNIDKIRGLLFFTKKNTSFNFEILNIS